MATTPTNGGQGDGNGSDPFADVREQVKVDGRYTLAPEGVGVVPNDVDDTGFVTPGGAPEAGTGLHPMPEYDPRTRAILAARAGNADQAFVSHLERMLRATTPADVLDSGDVTNGEHVNGLPLHVLGYAVWPGSIADDDGNFRNFAVLDAVEPETGEPLIITTSGGFLLPQLAHLDRMGAFPITMALNVFETRSGRNVHRLRAHPDYPLRSTHPVSGEAPADPAEAPTNGGIASQPEPVAG